jgi:hypothetical protein
MQIRMADTAFLDLYDDLGSSWPWLWKFNAFQWRICAHDGPGFHWNEPSHPICGPPVSARRLYLV